MNDTTLTVTHDDELAGRVPRILTLADGLIVNEVLHPAAVAAQRLIHRALVLDDGAHARVAAQETRARGPLAPAQSVS